MAPLFLAWICSYTGFFIPDLLWWAVRIPHPFGMSISSYRNDPCNRSVSEFGQAQFELPVAKHPRNEAFVRRLIFRFLPVV